MNREFQEILVKQNLSIILMLYTLTNVTTKNSEINGALEELCNSIQAKAQEFLDKEDS